MKKIKRKQAFLEEVYASNPNCGNKIRSAVRSREGILWIRINESFNMRIIWYIVTVTIGFELLGTTDYGRYGLARRYCIWNSELYLLTKVLRYCNFFKDFTVCCICELRSISISMTMHIIIVILCTFAFTL